MDDAFLMAFTVNALKKALSSQFKPIKKIVMEVTTIEIEDRNSNRKIDSGMLQSIITGVIEEIAKTRKTLATTFVLYSLFDIEICFETIWLRTKIIIIEIVIYI